jgi:hypothetical protein
MNPWQKYPMQRRLKEQDLYTPEEDQVYGVLAEFEGDPWNPDLRYFTPTRILYEKYRQWYCQIDWRWADAPSLLTEEQFGSALRQVFPQLRDYGRRVRRSYHGKREWGFLGLRGPDAIISTDRRGRPKKAVNSDR